MAPEAHSPLQLIVDAPPSATVRVRTRASAADARECFRAPASGGEQAAPRETTPLEFGNTRRWKLDAASSERLWQNSGPLQG